MTCQEKDLYYFDMRKISGWEKDSHLHTVFDIGHKKANPLVRSACLLTTKWRYPGHGGMVRFHQGAAAHEYHSGELQYLLALHQQATAIHIRFPRPYLSPTRYCRRWDQPLPASKCAPLSAIGPCQMQESWAHPGLNWTAPLSRG